MATATENTLAISRIDVKDRTRKDLGDVDALARSIESLGLLQPVVVTSDNKLVAGRRRIEACKALGWTHVPIVVADSVDSLLKLCQAESDENTCRKGFTPEEAVLMGQRIEGAIAAMNKKAQKEGQKQGGKKAGRGRPKKDEKVSAKLAESNRTDRETRTETAKAVGMKHTQYEKAKAVVSSGNQQAIDQMNKTGKVDPAYRAVKRDEKKQQLREKAEKASTEPVKQKWNIVLGDCLAELPKIKKARLIVTDPPYNIGVDYGHDGVDDDRAPDDYLKWCQQWINLSVNTLTPDGSMWIIICDEWAEHFAQMLNDAGLHRRAWIKWYETFGVNCTNNFNRCSRHILYYVVDPKKFVFNSESRYVRRPSDRQAKYGDKRADPDGKLLDDVWTVPRLVDNAQERIPDFPTQIPLQITRTIVACASEPGDLVVDPLCGSASTGHAALELHRRFTGIEIGEEFWELATVRLTGVTPFALDAL